MPDIAIADRSDGYQIDIRYSQIDYAKYCKMIQSLGANTVKSAKSALNKSQMDPNG